MCFLHSMRACIVALLFLCVFVLYDASKEAESAISSVSATVFEGKTCYQ